MKGIIMKKQLLQVLVVLASITMGHNAFGMQWLRDAQNFNPLETMHNGINHFEKNIHDIEQKINANKAILGNPQSTPAAIEEARADNEILRKNLEFYAGKTKSVESIRFSFFEGVLAPKLDDATKAKKDADRKEKIAEQAIENHFAKEKLEQETKIQTQATKDKIQAETADALAKIKADGVKTRKNLAALLTIATDPKKRRAAIQLVGGLVAVSAAAYYGVKFLSYVAEDMYRVPALAEKTTILPWHTKIYNWMFNVDVFEVTLDDVVLTPELENFFRGFVKSTKNTLENGGFCRHLLLPGPPGTGKTLMSMALANELGLPAIYFNAAKLSNCSVEDALVRIEKLFTYAHNSPVPVVIIIDESEIIFKHRNSADLTEKTRMIMNDIMAKTGTEQNDFILIALTNRPEDFDAAFKSRFSETIYINPPSYAQRKDMLEMYIDQYLINPTFERKKQWFDFGRTAQKKNAISIERDLFNSQALENLARQTDGFSGRDISQMILGIREEAFAQDHPSVNQELVTKIVNRKLEKKRKETVSAA